LVLLHAETREFVVHLDTDVLDSSELPSVNMPGSGGLRVNDARTILQELAKSKNLVGLDVAQYNPDKDPDGSGAKRLVDLLVEVLSARLASDDASGVPVSPPVETPAASVAQSSTVSEADQPPAPEPISDAPPVVDESATAEPHATVETSSAIETLAANYEFGTPEAPADAETPSASQADADAPEVSSSQTS
jgi:hypothetical protein